MICVVFVQLRDNHPPNINCVDAQGNSSLHCASYRGHKEAAVLLLQNGIDTGIRNTRGEYACFQFISSIWVCVLM